jgi:hypothetical protein
VEAYCELSDATSVINSSSTAAIADLMPDNATVGAWIATVPLQTAASFAVATNVFINCAAGPASVIGANAERPTLTAIQVTGLTIAP